MWQTCYEHFVDQMLSKNKKKRSNHFNDFLSHVFLRDEEFQICQKYKPTTKSHCFNLHVE